MSTWLTSAHTITYELTGEWPVGKTNRWGVTIAMFVDGVLAITVTAFSRNLVEAVSDCQETLRRAAEEFEETGQLLMDQGSVLVRYGPAVIRA